MVIKLASEISEFEQLFALNYETFVNEIPQHARNSTQKLVDKFHDKNNYIVAMDNDSLVGMLSFNENRPFSIEQKLSKNIEEFFPEFNKAIEIRLLAVKKEYRGTNIFFQLLKKLYEVLQYQDFDLGLISGTVRQLKLYNKIGFKPFGPLTGTKDALYQPMYISWDQFKNFIEKGSPA